MKQQPNAIGKPCRPNNTLSPSYRNGPPGLHGRNNTSSNNQHRSNNNYNNNINININNSYYSPSLDANSLRYSGVPFGVKTKYWRQQNKLVDAQHHSDFISHYHEDELYNLDDEIHALSERIYQLKRKKNDVHGVIRHCKAYGTYIQNQQQNSQKFYRDLFNYYIQNNIVCNCNN